MNNRYTFPILAVAIFAACLVVVAFVFFAPLPATTQAPQRGTIANPTNGDRLMRTIEHEGHLFVFGKIGYAGGMVHHPDCPCGKP